MGKDAEEFLFWIKISQSHGPLGVRVDEMEKNLSFFPPYLIDGYYVLGLRKLPRAAAEKCSNTEGSKSNRVDKILYVG